jgi:hypothetical protein
MLQNHPASPAPVSRAELAASRAFLIARLILLGLGLAALLWPGAALAGDEPARPPEPSASPWTVVRRVVAQSQGAGQVWQVDYRLRNDGDAVEVVPPGAVVVSVDGWVSNSRVAGHAAPRRARVEVSGPLGNAAYAEILPARDRDEERRCRERATLAVWPASAGEVPPNAAAALLVPGGAAMLGLPPVLVAPGDSLRVRLRLEHVHFLYGPYEPLLGPRPVVLRVGAATLRDELPLEQELTGARAVPTWPMFEPPADQLDAEVFVSPPHSLHLAAHRPGCASYRFSGPIRYGTRMRLSYWYLIAPGTEGDCKARLSQSLQGPAIHRSLRDGDHDQYLTTVGRWAHVERVFRTEGQATNLTLEFKLTGNLGEMWVDDVVLEPIDDGAGGP